eukprot:6212075-Amphidinium_carterae.3
MPKWVGLKRHSAKLVLSTEFYWDQSGIRCRGAHMVLSAVALICKEGTLAETRRVSRTGCSLSLNTHSRLPATFSGFGH